MRRTLSRLAGALALSLVTAAAIAAQPITYTFAGVGTGSYRGAAFANASFTVTATGSLPSAGYSDAGGISYFQGLVGAMTLGGVFTDGTFNAALSVTDNRSANRLVLGSSLGSVALIGLEAPAFGAYDLRTAFGPVTVSGAGVLAPEQFASVQVNGAPVTFSSVSALTFRAVVGTATTTAPEPAPLALLSGGTLMLAAASRRRHA